MSMNPGRFQVIKFGSISAPGAASTVGHLWGKNWPYLVKGIRAVVRTAAAGTTTLKIQKDTSIAFGSAVDLATITISSSDAAGTTFEAAVADASRDLASTDFIRIRHSAADASLVLDWELIATPADL